LARSSTNLRREKLREGKVGGNLKRQLPTKKCGEIKIVGIAPGRNSRKPEYLKKEKRKPHAEKEVVRKRGGLKSTMQERLENLIKDVKNSSCGGEKKH